ncbi:MAG TPA: acyl-CoA dehydrogenase family protein [Streptosporangiaceae bacterium]|nr:acyl-CoA dehydrogenase family protein [Streptosporangiaceae bacterium]
MTAADTGLPSGDPQQPAADTGRDGLLAGIRAHREEFEAAGERSEQLRTLPPDTVETLRGLGVFWLKTPADLGGSPLNPIEFCDVIEELAYADASTAWTAMIGAGCGGLASGWLPEAGARRVFAPDRPLPVVAGQLQPRGTGRPVPDGYVVTGRWSFASGIMHASWLIGAFRAPAAPATTAAQAAADGERIVVFLLPKDEAEVIDNWHVAGLQGTGSMDFRVAERFVPAEMTYELGAPAVRGGELFRLGMPAFVSNEVPPFCIGMARRALADTTALAGHTTRWAAGPKLSERAVFLKELGRAEVKIKAARLAHRDAVEEVWATARAGTVPPESQQLAITTASVFAVETCAEVISDLFRYGGGRVLSLSSPMQRHLRNALAARQHIAVSEEFYEAAGRLRIEAATGPQ